MTEQEINNIISQGEGYHSEFKVSIPSKVRDLTEEICAFANSAGGKLILGVDDQNILHGLTISNAQKSSIQNSINEISPPVDCTIEVYSVENKQIVVIDVKSSNNKPHVFLGVIYVRIGPNTQKLTTAEQMRDFFQQADKIHFDEKPCKEFDVLRDFDESHFKEFRSESGMPESIPDDQILRNLQVYAAEDIFKSGAVLFFAKKPEKFFEQAIIRCVAFRGETKRFIDDDKIFVGPLPYQFRQAINWVRGKINVGYDIEGQGSKARVEIWEISESVFKEAIFNALAHRDYYEKGAVTTIEVYDDRIEISNPGGLLSAVKGEFGK